MLSIVECVSFSFLASVLSGGKFANGAKSGAIVFALIQAARKPTNAERKRKASLKLKVGLGALKGEFDLLSSSKKGSLDLTESFGVEFDTDGVAKVTQGDKSLSLTSNGLKELEWGKKFIGIDGTAKYVGGGQFEFEGKYLFTQTRIIPFLDIELSYSSSLNLSLNGGMTSLTIQRIQNRKYRDYIYYGDI